MKLRNYFNIILNSAPKQTYLLFAKKLFPKYFQELFDNLKKIPRYTAAKTALLGKNIEIADAPFFSMYNEIFKKKFTNSKRKQRNLISLIVALTSV